MENKYQSNSSFVVLDDDPETIYAYANQTHGVYGSTVFVINDEQIAALRSGKVLAYGDGESLTIIRLSKNEGGAQ